jgi:Arylsulfotransferase (ASST)
MDSRLVRIALVLALAFTAGVSGQPGKDGPKGPKPGKPGVSVNDAKAFKGYTLVAPMNSTKAHLIDLEGHIVHTWECGSTPALSTYLLDNGNLLRPASMGKGGPGIPGAGGRIQEFSWDGTLVWDYKFESKNQNAHHDITRLPNGNVLMVVSDRKSKDEAIAAGRRPELSGDGVMADAIIEVKRTGKNTGEIVWEWHCWDHLVQDHDKTKANFGKVSAAPERIDVNYAHGAFGKFVAKKDGQDKLKGLGYIGDAGVGMGKFNPSADWTHVNAVAYNADLDQVMISVHAFSEIWIIDHSTTTKEAAGKTGGKYGKGGDLLYRWGNPQAYRTGTNAEQRLFQQHNAHWIPKGLPGAGNILVFNNGGRRPDGSYSSVDEIVPPVTKMGNYERKSGVAFGPKKAEWSYSAPTKSEFFAQLISGAHRLSNGNTLICSGPDSTVFEVTKEKEVVWKFVNPQKGGFGGGMFGFGPPSRPGEVLSKFMQDSLKLTPDQEKEIATLQKEVDDRLAKIMTEDQRAQLKKLREGGFGGKGPGKGPPGGFGPPGGGMGGGGPGGLFRSYRYGIDHPAFQGKTLTPGKKIEDL